MKIRKGDNVLVITGKDRGKKGKVRFVFPKDDRVLIEGINMIKTHSRARAQVRQRGIIEREAPISISNVMIICARCNQPVRIGKRELPDGTKTRFCHACSEAIE